MCSALPGLVRSTPGPWTFASRRNTHNVFNKLRGKLQIWSPDLCSSYAKHWFRGWRRLTCWCDNLSNLKLSAELIRFGGSYTITADYAPFNVFSLDTPFPHLPIPTRTSFRYYTPDVRLTSLWADSWVWDYTITNLSLRRGLTQNRGWHFSYSRSAIPMDL